MRIEIDPERPTPRDIGRIVDEMRSGEVVCYPTDTVYGLGCDIFQKKAIDKVYTIKGKDRNKPLSFICADLKDIAKYAIVGNNSYRLMKRILPGPYTVILQASREVPKAMLNKKKTVGIRIPDHKVPQMIVEQLGNPLITTSVPIPDGVTYNDPIEIDDRLGHQLALVVDSGIIYPEPSTILDLTDDTPRLVRQGKGEIESLGIAEMVEETEPAPKPKRPWRR